MTMKVGPKGQVVVPKTIRDELGISPGDHVDVFISGDEVRIRRAARFHDFLGCAPPAAGGMAAWDIESASEREREDRDQRPPAAPHRS